MPSPVRRADRLALVALLLLPGALVAGLAFAQGGFYPDVTALATVAVLLVLLARVTLARAPLAGLSVPLAVGAGALGGLAAWTLLSSGWSDAPGRAALEYGRVLLYLAVMVLFGTLGATERRARVLLYGLAAAAAAVCCGALAVFLLPERFDVGPGFPRERLSWPTSYWNATGLLAGLGVVWGGGLACSLRAAPWVRVAGAAAVPLCAPVLYLTVSRGAVVATAAGVLVLLVAQRSRGLVTGLLAAVPAALLAVRASAGAEGLAVEAPARAGVAAGEEAALVIVLAVTLAAGLRAVLLLADRRVRALPAVPIGRRAGLAGAAVLAVAAVALALAADAPSRAERAYDSFARGGTVPGDLAPRERFGQLSGNGRLEHWRVAVDAGYEPAPLRGSGAGTYALLWAAERDTGFTVLDAHSLVAETLGELGLVGLLLLAVALLASLVALAVRSARARDSAWAVLLAGAVTWTLHASVDWDWEMPALTVPVFAAGGLALGRTLSSAPRRDRDVGSAARIGLGLACLLLALMPVAILRSQRELDRATAALRVNDCRTATDAALASRDALGARPEPYALLAYCDVGAGRLDLAVRQVREAVRRDPGNWAWRYDQAIVDAVAGRDPRPAARAAFERNPKDPRVRDVVRRFKDGGRDDWRRRALQAPLLLEPSRDGS